MFDRYFWLGFGIGAALATAPLVYAYRHWKGIG